MVAKFIYWFIHPKYLVDDQQTRKARLLVITLLFAAVFSMYYTVFGLLTRISPSFYAAAGCAVVCHILPFWFRKGAPQSLVANIFVGFVTVGTCLSCWFTGGFESPVLSWLAFPPLAALLLADRRSGYVWAAISVGMVIGFGMLKITNSPLIPPLAHARNYQGIIANYVGLVLLLFVVAMALEIGQAIAIKQLMVKNALLAHEKQRSENLLLNILPEDVAEELKRDGRSAVRKFELVTVVFADIVNFTQLTESLTPDGLIRELDICFEAFDAIADRHNLEKIKAIGDAYLCAGGLPVANDTNPQDAVRAALEMQEFMSNLRLERSQKGGPIYNIRIGIHTGPLVAGIVGKKKFAYDIWGDTVNLAARMETAGEPGKVNISQATYDLVKEDFKCEYRGRIAVKNKGEVEMYFVG